MSDHPEAFLSNFGNVLAHMVSAECNENDTSLADCVEFDLSSSGSGSGSPNQPDHTIHAGLICEGMQISRHSVPVYIHNYYSQWNFCSVITTPFIVPPPPPARASMPEGNNYRKFMSLVH